MSHQILGMALRAQVDRLRNQDNLNIVGSLPVGVQGQPFTWTPILTGGTGSYQVTRLSGAAMPSGLSLNASTGVISGTYSGSTVAHRMILEIRDTSTNKASVREIVLMFTPAAATFTLTGTTTHAGRQNVAFAGFTPTATNAIGSVTYSILAGSIAGLSVNTSTGALTGTFTGYGTGQSITIQGVDSASNVATITLTFNVTRALALSGSPPSGAQNSAYPGFTPSLVGGSGGTAFTISVGTLFTGLTINGSTGAITGISTQFGTNNVTIRAQDSAGFATTLAISIVIAEEGSAPLIETTFDPYYDSGFSLNSNTTIFSRPTQAKPSAKATSHSTASYTDQRFGTRIYRLSDVADQQGHSPTYFRHEYSRKQPFNADSSKVLIQATNGFWYIADANTYAILDGGRTTTPGLGAIGSGTGNQFAGDCEPTWHPTNPNKLWRTDQNGGLTWYEFDIVTKVTTTLFSFSGRLVALGMSAASRVWWQGEGRPSDDGRWWGFAVQDTGFNQLGLICYDRQTDTIVGSIVTSNKPNNVSTSPSGMYVVPSWSSATSMTFAAAAAAAIGSTNGTRAYSRDFSTYQQMSYYGEHADTATDAYGNDVYVSGNYNNANMPDVLDGSMYYRRMDNGVAYSLAPKLYSPSVSPAFHVSGCARKRRGWVVWGTYGNASGGGASYTDEIISLVELVPTGGRVLRLAHHQSRLTDSYWGEPHATVNPDLTRVIFASDYGGAYEESYVIGLASDHVPEAGVALPIKSADPVVTGAATPGGTLTVSDGTWDGIGITYTRQWKSNGVNISGQTGTTFNVPMSGYLGAVITCTVTASNSVGPVQATSNGVTIAVLSPPANTVAPAITGGSAAGSVLTCSTGTWTANPSPAFGYHWEFWTGTEWDSVGSATNTLTADEPGAYRCRVAATNSMGVSAKFSETFTVNPAPDVKTLVGAPVSNTATGTGSGSVTKNGITAGNSLVLVVACQEAAAGDGLPVIANTLGATWEMVWASGDLTVTAGRRGKLSVWRANNCNAGNATVSMTFGSGSHYWASVEEVNGGLNITDVIASATGNEDLGGISTRATGPAAMTVANAVVLAGGMLISEMSNSAIALSGTGWTAMGTARAAGPLHAVAGIKTVTESTVHNYNVTSTPGSYGDGWATFCIVLTSAPEVVLTEGTFGTLLTNGGANWGGNPDRAMLDRFTLTENADVYQLQVWMLQAAGHTGGAHLRGIIYSDVADAPGNFIAVGSEVTIPSTVSAPARVILPITASLVPGNYWLGVVGDGYNYEIGSGAHSNPQSALIVGLGYASPAATCPVPAGRYNNDVGIYANYLTDGGSVGTGVVAPVNTVAPSITGNTQWNSILTVGLGTWGGTSLTYTYQWFLNDVSISGATNNVYTSLEGQLGGVIKCVVTAENSEGRVAVLTSNSIVVTEVSGGGGDPVLQWFGNQSTTATSASSTSANRALIDRFQLTYNADVQSLFCYFNTVAAGAATNFRGIIAADDGGAPGAIIAMGNSGVAPQVNGYGESVFPAGVTLTPGWYWLGIVASSHTAQIRQTVGVSPNSILYNGNFNFSSPPATCVGLTVGASYDSTIAAYVTFLTEDEEPDLTEPPINTLPPAITGSAVIGNVLTCSTGTWTGYPTPVLTYQWYANNVAISGATSNTLNTTGRSNGDVIKCRVTGTNIASAVYVETTTRTLMASVDLTLTADLSYVDTGSAKYTSWVNFVNTARDGVDPYGFSATDAAYLYQITGNTSYRTLAIDTIEAIVVAAEAAIAANGQPHVAGDSYLEAGPVIGPLAITYQLCASGMTSPQRARWAAFADQCIYNIWNHTVAFWGANSFPWTGWSVNNPGNNYHYSFCTATAYWALASDNIEMLTWLDDNKFNPLRAYFAGFPGGGSREGTGYGVSFMNLFDLYQIWKDSGQSELALANSHMTDTLYYWIHATVATRDRFFSIGDLARDANPVLFDYHRHLMLRARHLAVDVQARADASWWLNNISIQTMTQGFERRADLVPPGSNTSTPPTALTYYAEATGNVFTRNNWTTGGTNVHFLCGIYDESHAAMQQGMFQIFKGGFLTGTANMYSPSGIDQNVEYQNVLRFNTSGGSIINQSNGTATMDVDVGSGGSVTCDMALKGIMSNSTVTSWNRVATYNATANTVNIVDTYATTSGTTATFQLITPTLPTVVGNTITCGNLVAVVNTPGSPTITVIDLEATTTLEEGYRVDISGGSGTYNVTMTIN